MRNHRSQDLPPTFKHLVRDYASVVSRSLRLGNSVVLVLISLGATHGFSGFLAVVTCFH